MLKSGEERQWVTEDFPALVKILVLNSLGFFFLGFIIPYVSSQELDASGTQLGILFAVHPVGFIVSSGVATFLADRVSKKKMLIVGSIIRGLAYFILYFAIIAKSLPFVIVGWFSLGFVGVFWVPYNSLVSQKSDKNHRSFAFGNKSRATGIGSLVGGLIGMTSFMILTQVIPTNSPLIYIAFPIFGIGNFLSGFLYWSKIDEDVLFVPTEDHSREKTHPLQPLEEKSEKRSNSGSRSFIFAFALLLGTFFLANINGSISKPFIQIYMLENIENDPFWAALAWAPSGLVSFLIAARMGKVIDRIDLRVGIAIISGLGALVTWILINLNTLWEFALLLLLDTAIVNAADLTIQNIFSRISIKNRGKVFGIQNAFGQVGSIIGPIIGGVVWDLYGQKFPFIISIFVELALIPVFIAAITVLRPHFAEKLEDRKQLKKGENS